MWEKAVLEKKIRAKIMEAMDKDGFFMLYQPKVDANTLEIAGFAGKRLILRNRKDTVRGSNGMDRPGMIS